MFCTAIPSAFVDIIFPLYTRSVEFVLKMRALPPAMRFASGALLGRLFHLLPSSHRVARRTGCAGYILPAGAWMFG